jgi:1-acyl-sn-glycerol-3-phosphate acyltransferase
MKISVKKATGKQNMITFADPKTHHRACNKMIETQIDIQQLLRSKLGQRADKIPRCVVNYLIRITHQDEINEILRRYRHLEGVDFMKALVKDYFRVDLRVEHIENLPPPGGRYIFASNHPLGGFDGICLAWLLGRHYDQKIKYLVNDLLLAIPNLRSIFIPVNKHGVQSREAIRVADEAYRSTDQIITFPAGLCSRRRHGLIRDPEWKKSFIRQAVRHQRDIVPIHFEGCNSAFFYRLANLRTFLRLKTNLEMLYLPNELFRQKNKTFCIHIGMPLAWQTFTTADRSAMQWAAWMREEVYKLKNE